MSDLKIRPRGRFRDILREIYFVDGIIAVGVFAYGVMAAIKYFRDGDDGFGTLSLITAFILLLLSWHKQLLLKHAKDDKEWLYVFLDGLRDVIESVGDSKDDKFRICVHVKSGPETWKQHTEYVEKGGQRSAGKVNRTFPRRCGIIGNAAADPHKATFGNLMFGRTREKYMMETFRYERHEIAKLSGNRKSWGAVCLGEPEDFQVVIYCDSAEANYFTGKKNNPREKVLNAAGVALARRLASR